MIDSVKQRSASQSCLEHLRNFDITEVTHEAVLDYIKAAEIRARFNLTGCETKSLLLKGKSGDFFVFLTFAENRIDFKKLRAVLGMKVEVASPEELLKETACLPGSLGPFGLQSHITLVVERCIFDAARLIFTPGDPTITIEMTSDDLERVLHSVENRKVYLSRDLV